MSKRSLMVAHDEDSFDDITDIGAGSYGKTAKTEQDDDDFDIVRGFDPDIEYENECGYTLIKMLRGKNIGRRFKRNLFKYDIALWICGMVIFILTCTLSDLYGTMGYFTDASNGLSILAGMWLVSLFTLAFAISTTVAIRNWGSLVTNRNLLVQLFQIYLFVLCISFVLTAWTAAAWILVFQGEDFEEGSILPLLYNFYACSLAFLFPQLIITLYYLQHIYQLVKEVIDEGDITEPDVDELEVSDMSDVDLFQICIFVFASPCILAVQCFDFCGALKRAYERHYRDYFPEKKKSKRRGICARLYRTVCRKFTECITGRTTFVLPAKPPEETSPDLELQNQYIDREEQERLDREKAAKEKEEEAARMEAERLEAERQALEEKQRQEAEGKELAARKSQLDEAEAERLRQLEEEEQLRKEMEEQERLRKEMEEEAAKEADIKSAMILSVNQFKGMWSKLGTAGSFQAKLKILPESGAFTAHLKKQGFHVVFVSTPTPTDLEIGLCNKRYTGEEKWFMARFLATQNSFSAVMKAEDSSQVTSYVKKFGLAKVLKIDTAK